MECDQVSAGGVVQFHPDGHFLLIKGCIVVFGGALDGGIEGVAGLDQDFAPDKSPAGSSGHLGDELETAFLRTEIRDVQSHVRIDNAYKGKRKAVYEEEIKFAQKEEKLFALDDQKAEEVRQAVSQEVADRWFVITKNQLDYTLQKRYGLDKSQITRFKTAYNIYAIEEYRILGDKKLSTADKLQQLSDANRQFCETVQPLFASEAYTRWQGWRQYTFDRKMKQKKLM